MVGTHLSSILWIVEAYSETLQTLRGVFQYNPCVWERRTNEPSNEYQAPSPKCCRNADRTHAYIDIHDVIQGFFSLTCCILIKHAYFFRFSGCSKSINIVMALVSSGQEFKHVLLVVCGFLGYIHDAAYYLLKAAFIISSLVSLSRCFETHFLWYRSILGFEWA